MQFFMLVICALNFLVCPAIAGDLENGMQFYGSKNYSKAVKSFKTAADQGNAMAQYNLGLMYAKGEGLAQDYQQALFWLRKAAEQGVALAAYNLAVMHDNGLGVARDYPQAITWYRKAAEQGVALAYFNLGVMYDNGLGIAQDYPQAVSSYRTAAERGIAQAQYNLAVMYESGLGVSQDYAQAAAWYRKAAERGIVQAQSALSEMYGKGLGVPQDQQQAVIWHRKAAVQEITTTIQRWAKAWSAKDVAGYLAFYAENFKAPAGVSLADWKISRQAQIEKPKSIAVSISDLQINFSDDMHAVIRLKQNYRSPLFKDMTDKMLTLTRSKGKWLIESEGVTK